LLYTAVTEVGISALSALPELREFIFWNDYKSEKWHLSKCLQYLPHLHVLGCRLSPDNVTVTNFPSNLTQVLQEMKLTSDAKFPSLQLQQVALNGLDEMPKDVLLPQLRVLQLMIIPPVSFFSLNTEFSQLTELSLKGQYFVSFIPLLERVGHQLRSLSLCIKYRLQLDRALNSCPNLEEFHLLPYLPGEFLNLTYIVLVEELKTLPKLRVLNIAAAFTSNVSPISTLLLAVPNLHSLRLMHFPGPRMKMMDEIVLHLQNSTILQNLRTLILPPISPPQFHALRLTAKIPEPAERYWDMHAKVFFQAIVILHCPCLQDFIIEKS
jgi:hypothetical protein